MLSTHHGCVMRNATVFPCASRRHQTHMAGQRIDNLSYASADHRLPADKIYGGSCTLSQDLMLNSTTGHCDSQYFICRPLTTQIYAYDDPVTGWAYACVDNPAGSETCGEGDVVNLCVSWSFPPRHDLSSRSIYLHVPARRSAT